MKKNNKKEELIESLTPEQEAMLPKYYEEYYAKIISTRPTDKPKAEAAIKASYAYLKLKEPEIIWTDSPRTGAKLAAQMVKGSLDVTQEEIQSQASQASYGSFEAYWVSMYAFIAEQLHVEHDGLINIVKDIVDECGVYWAFEDAVVISPKPSIISLNAEGLLDGGPDQQPAFGYANGDCLYAVNGKCSPSLLEATMSQKLGSEE